jgi:cytochrome c biogenesis protein CcdA/thiol-disulfide isomerase/thioredoxin
METIMDSYILGLSFIEGMGLILSPCILPILPLILVTGIQGGALRPYGIITGFIATFVAFTLFARKLFSGTNIDPMLLQDITIYLILAFGFILYSDYLSEKFAAMFQRLANLGQTLSDKAEGKLPKGYWSGVLIGSGIALIWTPCAGPIMAVVLVQTIQQKADYEAALTLTAFSVGVALPMLIITIFSKSIIARVRVLSHHTQTVRKVLAAIIIITMLFTKFNIWQKLFVLQGPPMATGQFLPATELKNALSKPYPAPKIDGILQWINSEPLDLTTLQKQGKVVLIDFWTYSCINCVRTLPYIKNWHEKYHDKGLVIIGVHSPEFEFEKNLENIQQAVKDDGIKYPVAVDSDLATWNNFKNSYWPGHYLINKQGQVVYTHFGEGEYDVTENNIRYLLGLGTMDEFKKPAPEAPSPISKEQSPETYLGLRRQTGFASPEKMSLDQVGHFTYPAEIPVNGWALNGDWKAADDKVIAQQAGASLRYHFTAKKVYLVMASTDRNHPQKVKVLLDGKPVGVSAGKDVKDNQVVIKESTLYELVSLPKLGSGVVEIQAESAGLQVFVFTFGSE